MYHHVDGDLNVNRLADVAMMSPYHFHRIYRQMSGETVNVTVRRLRLQRAAAELIRSDMPLKEIAAMVSYGSVEAFHRAFLTQFGEAPSEYRKARQQSAILMEPFVAMLPNSSLEYNEMYNVEIMDVEQALLVGYEHGGDYMNIGNAFEKLFMYAGTHGLLSDTTRSIGLYYDDPKSTAEDELRSMACITIDQALLNNDSDAPKNNLLPAGQYATILHKGSYAELEKPYDWFFGHWLVENNKELADFPAFEEYYNDPKTTAPSELLTRIHFKLA